MVFRLLRYPCLLLVVAAGVALLFSSCYPTAEPSETKPSEEEEPPKLSAIRTIVDTSGRSLAVEIIGRSSDSVTFVRQSDKQRFTLPVTKLSSKDQMFVADLPIVEAPPDPKTLATEEAAATRGPLGFALDRRKEVLKELDRVASEIPKYPGAPSKVAALNREQTKLSWKLEEVEAEIRLLKAKK